jgi:hypothetical protein
MGVFTPFARSVRDVNVLPFDEIAMVGEFAVRNASFVMTKYSVF